MISSIAYLSLSKFKFLFSSFFQNLLGAISLRRIKEVDIGTKSMIELPPKTVLECYIDLSDEEREIYDQMELAGKNKMQEFGDRDSILRNYSTVLYFILRLRQLCVDVSLCPLDVKSWVPSNSIEGIPFSYLVYFEYVTTYHDEQWPDQAFYLLKMISETY